ncbi:MAG TPA: DUF6379 domain-containing protein [Streptosporangiaceae bacterium]|nr:DUF6379 domain-containing protein [Streptosporangiaceae bacterium]
MGPLDKDVVRDDALHVTGDGFALDIRSHWYRSLPLTSLAVLDLAVDGEAVPEEDMTIVVNGKTFTVPELAGGYDEWWYVLDPIALQVSKPGFDRARPHQIEFGLGLSIPYILIGKQPLLAASHSSRTLTCQ